MADQILLRPGGLDQLDVRSDSSEVVAFAAVATYAYRTHRLLHIWRVAISLTASLAFVHALATDTAFSLSRRGPRHHLTDASAARLWTSRMGWVVFLAFTVGVLATEIVSLLNRDRNVITISDDAIVIPRHEWSRKALTIQRDEVRFIERSRPRFDGGFQRCDLSFGTDTKRLNCTMFKSGADFDACIAQIAKITGLPLHDDLGF